MSGLTMVTGASGRLGRQVVSVPVGTADGSSARSDDAACQLFIQKVNTCFSIDFIGIPRHHVTMTSVRYLVSRQHMDLRRQALQRHVSAPGPAD
jgi:hypothetical protein